MKGYKQPSILESLIIAVDVLNEEYHCSCISVMLWELGNIAGTGIYHHDGSI